MSKSLSSWISKYPSYKVSLTDLYINDEWSMFFKNRTTREDLDKISRFLSDCLKVNKNRFNTYPYPDMVFNCFNTTPLSDVKVVILGQDPYFSFSKEANLPQATGLSFSVPNNPIKFATPSSLQNIYKNLLNFGHIPGIPNHGSLDFWAYQGCLMLNSSLTVEDGHPNSHRRHWERITDRLIKFISDSTNNTVFLLWGAFALSKQRFIDQKRHKVIASSHPSGLSCNSTIGVHPSFNKQDHFGECNKYLKKHNKDQIIWNIV